jgi:anaerobic dimethyl sulfoxide reductase subunit B
MTTTAQRIPTQRVSAVPPPGPAQQSGAVRPAFHFDASACSGCKACVIACRDRNDLPAGVRWRRVYELAGGGWTRRGDAWVNDVVAYNISMACNHCELAACVAACPTGAMHTRADGIVTVDGARCIGCRYCEWACPYGAPQYDAAAGRMTKCTLCADDLAAGLQPACVAACPLRALETCDAAATPAGGAASTRGMRMQPLPDPALTRPALLVTAHAAAVQAGGGAAAAMGTAGGAAGAPAHYPAPAGPRAAVAVANREEVTNAAAQRMLREPSLVAFTLLVQAAAGITWTLLALRTAGADAGYALLPLASAGALLAAGGAAAAAHLGTPLSAWRAAARVRTSWLSREVAAAMVFAVALAAALLAHVPGGSGALAGTWLLGAAAASGLGLVWAMARVYRLPAVPAWNSPLTTASFILTAAGLGALTAAWLMAVAGAGYAWLGGVGGAGTLGGGGMGGLGGWLAPEATVTPPIALPVTIAAIAIACDALLEPLRRDVRRTAVRRVDTRLFPAAAESPAMRGAVRLQVASVALLVLLLLGWAALARLGAAAGAAAALDAVLPWLAAAVLGVALCLAAAAAIRARAGFYAVYARIGL